MTGASCGAFQLCTCWISPIFYARHESHLLGNAATEGVHIPWDSSNIHRPLPHDHRAIWADSVHRLFRNFVTAMFNFCIIHAIPLIFPGFLKKKKKKLNQQWKRKLFLEIRSSYTILLYFHDKKQFESKSIYATELFLSRKKFIERLYPIFCERDRNIVCEKLFLNLSRLIFERLYIFAGFFIVLSTIDNILIFVSIYHFTLTFCVICVNHPRHTLCLTIPSNCLQCLPKYPPFQYLHNISNTRNYMHTHLL